MAVIALTPVVLAMYSDGMGGYRSAVPTVSVSLTTRLITSGIGTMAINAGVSKSITGQSTTSVAGSLNVSVSKSISLTGQGITSSIGTLSVTVVDSIQLTPSAVTLGTTVPTITTTRFPNIFLSGLSITSSRGTLTASTSGSSFAPNRPVGLTTIVDRQWNPTDPSIPGGVLPPPTLSGTDSKDMVWFTGDSPSGAASVVPLIDTPAALTTTIGQTIPSLPSGNSTCLAIRYRSGWPSGYRPFGLAVNTVPTVRHMYLTTEVCIPAGFDSNSNNIKWVFFAGGDSRNHVFMLSSGASGAYMGPWIATQGGGGSFYMGGNSSYKPGATVNLQNNNLPALQGTWMNVEWEVILETTPGVSADGVCKFWVNNVLRGHWTNLNWNTTSGDAVGFNEIVFSPYYGGGGGNAPSLQYICVGRFLAAGGN